MNRFGQSKKKRRPLINLISSAVIIVCALFLLRQSAVMVSQTTTNSQAESLRQAIVRSCVHCYAVEGTYPESLSYLKGHYGIHWNPEHYVVDYQIIGSNQMPSVTVIPLHKSR